MPFLEVVDNHRRIFLRAAKIRADIIQKLLLVTRAAASLSATSTWLVVPGLKTLSWSLKAVLKEEVVNKNPYQMMSVASMKVRSTLT